MKPPVPPRLEHRRTSDFAAELSARARAWIPSWSIADDEPDFGRALLQIGARYNAEVAEQLDGAGAKLRDGLFDWLGVHGEAARPARVPVAFKLADKAIDPVLATAPSRLQASVDGVSVVFETETDVQLVPSKLERIVAVEADHFYLPPPGLASLEPVLPLPEQWSLKSFAAPSAEKLQLDPDEGLLPGLVLRSDGQRFRIKEADKGLATIEPPLRDGLAQGAIVRKVAQFAPFDGLWNDEQVHALYFGSTDLFDITAAATLDILGARDLVDVKWEYWGKRDEHGVDPDVVTWQPLDKAKIQKYSDGLTLLKPKGAVEPREIVKGMSARWIRAVSSQVKEVLLGVDQLSVRINYDPLPATCQGAATNASVGFEAMSNTTPLVVSSAFYPLGRAPRQFDAFYVGSAEAFSKKDADVQLCVQLADLSFQNFACLRTGPKTDTVLAGVTRDGGVQLLEFSGTPQRLFRYHGRPALHPPSPGLFGARVDAAPVTLRQGAIAIWNRSSDVLVAATADDAVWVWRESDDALFGSLFSGWKKLPDVPVVPPAVGPTPGIDSLVYVSPNLVALRDKTLYQCNPDDATPAWTKVVARIGGVDIEFTRIAPILVAGAIPTNPRAVGVAMDQKLYALAFAGTNATCTALRTAVDTSVTPAAILRSDDTLAAVAVGPGPGATERRLLGFLSNPNALTSQALAEASIGESDVLGNALGGGIANARGVFAACLGEKDGRTKLSRWSPFEAPTLSGLKFDTPVPPGLGPAAGAPTVLPAHLVVPVLSSQVLVAPFDPTKCVLRQGLLRTAIITKTLDPLQAADRVAFPIASAAGFEIASAGATSVQGGEVLFEYDARAVDDPIFVYPPAAAAATPSVVAPAALDTVVIAATHTVTPNVTRLLIATSLSTQTYLVTAFNTTTRVATLDRDLDVPATPPATVDYWMPATAPIPNDRRVVPLLRLDPNTSGDWDAALLDRILLALPGGDPAWQKGHAFQADVNGHPILVDLETPWVIPPAVALGKADFIVDGAVQAWTGQLADTTSNPALSWEYWNGTGWWNLDATDNTQHLKRSGAITFKVPTDLKPTDWSGKTSHWIRARLIGGDYGQEEVKVINTPTSGGGSEQTIERNSDNIRAPYVAQLHLSYAMKDGVLPAFVLAQDSGSIRDQSEANRTPNAIVEAFVPLPVLLGRMSRPAVHADDADDCPKPCDCNVEKAAGMDAAGERIAGPVVESAGRALFLGFKGLVSGGPVRLYLRVVERAGQGARDALKVDALVADRFVPLVVEDDTRGLGESGMFTLVFDAEPTPRDLFGTTLRWLRVTSSGDASTWAPILQGAYLNAAWASATETMRYERLGSSEGAPNLVLNLARPPVLSNTLELRVLEPLGDEERAMLLADDPVRVVRNVSDLPGDWVRWDQVFDPADEDPDARVYALDEATGEIVFGDGEHGMIPPIGRDSIVAFRYQRTEPAADGSDRVPANAVEARTKLNLGSPVAGVEAVFAADQAAGGAPPEAAPRILRFGGARLRHRNRAVSAPDLEDLALQSSPDIAQARCFMSRSGVRLVVVMRGIDPTPNAAQRRELERLLLGVSPVTLGALRIEGPTLRSLGARLQLRVRSLDDAGGVARAVRARIAAWFDAVSGDADGQGWPLRRSPDDSDIALALVDTPSLAGVADVVLHEIVDGVLERPWPASLRAADLVVLRDDALHLAFSTAEVVA